MNPGFRDTVSDSCRAGSGRVKRQGKENVPPASSRFRPSLEPARGGTGPSIPHGGRTASKFSLENELPAIRPAGAGLSEKDTQSAARLCLDTKKRPASNEPAGLPFTKEPLRGRCANLRRRAVATEPRRSPLCFQRNGGCKTGAVAAQRPESPADNAAMDRRAVWGFDVRCERSGPSTICSTWKSIGRGGQGDAQPYYVKSEPRPERARRRRICPPSRGFAVVPASAVAWTHPELRGYRL